MLSGATNSLSFFLPTKYYPQIQVFKMQTLEYSLDNTTTEEEVINLPWDREYFRLDTYVFVANKHIIGYAAIDSALRYLEVLEQYRNQGYLKRILQILNNGEILDIWEPCGYMLKALETLQIQYNIVE
jgi:hypothetical protein